MHLWKADNWWPYGSFLIYSSNSGQYSIDLTERAQPANQPCWPVIQWGLDISCTKWKDPHRHLEILYQLVVIILKLWKVANYLCVLKLKRRLFLKIYLGSNIYQILLFDALLYFQFKVFEWTIPNTKSIIHIDPQCNSLFFYISCEMPFFSVSNLCWHVRMWVTLRAMLVQ